MTDAICQSDNILPCSRPRQSFHTDARPTTFHSRFKKVLDNVQYRFRINGIVDCFCDANGLGRMFPREHGTTYTTPRLQRSLYSLPSASHNGRRNGRTPCTHTSISCVSASDDYQAQGPSHNCLRSSITHSSTVNPGSDEIPKFASQFESRCRPNPRNRISAKPALSFAHCGYLTLPQIVHPKLRYWKRSECSIFDRSLRLQWVRKGQQLPHAVTGQGWQRLQ